MRLRAFIVFILALLPSACYVLKNPGMPEFGRFHDDGLLFVSAKALADGDGFVISSLPERPAQTKYPVLYPLFLSLVWKLNPHFPDNLWIARLMNWLLLVLCLGLSWIYYRSEGISEGKTMLLVALLGLNPWMILVGTNTFSEVFFICWMIVVFLLMRFRCAQASLWAGIAVGCAYLSRTAGIAFLAAIPAWYGVRRQYRHITQFLIGMLPFVAGWMLWSRHHLLPTQDPTLIYYTDYLKMEFLTIGLDNFHLVLWKNVDGLLAGFGGLAIPQVFGSLPVKILTQAVGVAMISGTIRLFRRGIAQPYAFFAAVTSAMLLAWHFQPNERFVLPLLPLLLLGLVTELEHLAAMLRSGFRHSDPAQRRVAIGMACVASTIVVGVLAVQCLMSFRYLYESARQYQAKLYEMRAAYAWIVANVPDSARILSNDDPILYLYSGRRGRIFPMVPGSWYGEDHKDTVAAYRDIAAYGRGRGFDYFYWTLDDTSRWTNDPGEIQSVRRSLRENPELTPLFQSSFGTVYRIR
jgi:hypothetical protein